MHAFAIHPVHLHFFVISVVLVFGLFGISTVLRSTYENLSYGGTVLALWALLVSCAFLADFSGLSPGSFVSLLGIGLGGIVWFCKPPSLRTYLQNNDWGRLAGLFCAWLVSLAILSLPLTIAAPVKTLILGHFVNNDSVLHAMLLKGLSFLNSQDLPAYYSKAAPRGFHSLFYYFNSLTLRREAYEILVPALVVAYSFVVMSADYILSKFESAEHVLFTALQRALICLAPVAPFLVVMTLYLVFASQITTIPFLMATVVGIGAVRIDERPEHSLLLLLGLGCFAAYGIFPLSIVFFALGLRILSEFLKDPQSFKAGVRSFFSNRLSCSSGVVLLGLLVLAYPCVRYAFETIRIQFSNEMASDLLTSVGNLGTGFVSPLHISGLWKAKTDYRSALVGPDSYFNYLLMLIVLGQVCILSTPRLGRGLGIGLVACLVPVIASALLPGLSNPYICFKYLTFLVVCVSIVTPIVLFRRLHGRSPSVVLGASLIYAVFLAMLIGTPLSTYSVLPPLGATQLREMKKLSTTYFKRGPTLVLSVEDWFQYFVERKDTFVPLTLYVPRQYTGVSLKTVVYDQAYASQNDQYLQNYPVVAKAMAALEVRCRREVGGRYVVYDLECR